MPDLICIGEMLVDFICSDTGSDLVSGINFVKKAGGAPANVAAGCAKLGIETGFIGKVGKDPFGMFLKNTLFEAGVDIKGLVLDDDYKTSLAFVSLQTNGERDFDFFREPGADTLLKINEIDKNYLKNVKIFHFGSISLIGGEIKKTVLYCLEKIKNTGAVISFDPNIRLNLWKKSEDALNGINIGLYYADIVKMSEPELEFISGFKDHEKAVREIHKRGPKVVVVTLGEEGAKVSNGSKIIKTDGYKVRSVDTTGAGDGFTAGLIYGLLHLSNIKTDMLEICALTEIADFANKTGALVTTKYGAISAMPSLNDVEAF